MRVEIQYFDAVSLQCGGMSPSERGREIVILAEAERLVNAMAQVEISSRQGRKSAAVKFVPKRQQHPLLET